MFWFRNAASLQATFSTLEYHKLIHYHRGNFLQAPLEALLSLYFVEILVLFTGRFFSKLLDANQMLPLIFVPMLIGFLVCIVYTAAASILITAKLIKIAGKEEIGIASLRWTLCMIHIAGIMCYAAVGWLSGVWLEHAIAADPSIVHFLAKMGLAAGLAWNIIGYLGDNMVDWGIIMKKQSIGTPLDKRCNYYIAHLVTNVLAISGVLVTSMWALAVSDIVGEAWDIATYYLFISLFVAVIIVYLKTVIRHFYLRNSDHPKIYFTPSDLIEKVD